MRPVYRVRQFFKAFHRPDAAALRATAAAHLSAMQLALFEQLSLYDQRHAVEVLERIQKAGHTQAELMQAALLHDVGKAFVQTRLWHRVAYVLARGVSPQALESKGTGLLAAYARHAEIGAELAEQAGTSPTAVALIREHHRQIRGEPRTPFEAMLEALQSADELA